MNEAVLQNVLLSGPPGSTRIQYSILRASASLLRVLEYRGLRKVCRLISPFFSRNNSAVIEQNGLRLRIYLNDAYWVRYALCGFSYEAEFAPVLDELLDSRAIFLDCGANIGYWSVYAATRVGSSNRVVAVEPSERTFARLLENSELNGRSFTAVRKAVYSRSGEKLRLQVHPARHESNSIVPHRLAVAQGYRSELVDSVTIDDLFESVPIGNVGVSNVVVKLDVEGAEREAFRGAQRLIDCGAIFIYEDHGSDPKCANTDFLLNALGLEIHFLDGRMQPLQIRDLKQLVALKTCSTRGYNLVAARRESPALTRLLKAYSSQQARGRDGSGDPANPHQQAEIVAVARARNRATGFLAINAETQRAKVEARETHLLTTKDALAHRTKRILLVGVLGPFDSGPTRVYETLLKSRFTERFEVRFLDLQFASDVADFHRPRPQKFFRLLGYLLRTTYWLLRESYDALCIPLSTNRNAFLKDSLFVWLGVLFGVPVVVFEHGTNIPSLYERGGRVLRWFMRTTLRRTTCCIVLADCLRFNFEPFLPPDRIVSVYLGIDPITTNGQPDGPRNDNDKLTILFLSVLQQSKGLFVLLQSLPRVLRVRNSLRCVVAGGWGRDSKHVKEWVTQFISSEHLEGTVSFVGPVQGKEKERILNAADVFVLPTLADASPHVVLEAMRAGLPIVATNVGAIPELVSDGINGLICQKGDYADLAEKILYLAGRPALRQQMRQNNLARFESFFTADKFVARMIDAFESVFAEARGER